MTSIDERISTSFLTKNSRRISLVRFKWIFFEFRSCCIRLISEWFIERFNQRTINVFVYCCKVNCEYFHWIVIHLFIPLRFDRKTNISFSMPREDREPDELFEIRTNFYTGNYQQVINEATKLKVKQFVMKNKIDFSFSIHRF